MPDSIEPLFDALRLRQSVRRASHTKWATIETLMRLHQLGKLHNYDVDFPTRNKHPIERQPIHCVVNERVVEGCRVWILEEDPDRAKFHWRGSITFPKKYWELSDRYTVRLPAVRRQHSGFITPELPLVVFDVHPGKKYILDLSRRSLRTRFETFQSPANPKITKATASKNRPATLKGFRPCLNWNLPRNAWISRGWMIAADLVSQRLDTQLPFNPYVVGAIASKGVLHWTDVHGMGKWQKRPSGMLKRGWMPDKNSIQYRAPIDKKTMKAWKKHRPPSIVWAADIASRIATYPPPLDRAPSAQFPRLGYCERCELIQPAYYMHNGLCFECYSNDSEEQIANGDMCDEFMFANGATRVRQPHTMIKDNDRCFLGSQSREAVDSLCDLSPNNARELHYKIKRSRQRFQYARNRQFKAIETEGYDELKAQRDKAKRLCKLDRFTPDTYPHLDHESKYIRDSFRRELCPRPWPKNPPEPIMPIINDQPHYVADENVVVIYPDDDPRAWGDALVRDQSRGRIVRRCRHAGLYLVDIGGIEHFIPHDHLRRIAD
jgi:hypothetical protein